MLALRPSAMAVSCLTTSRLKPRLTKPSVTFTKHLTYNPAGAWPLTFPCSNYHELFCPHTGVLTPHRSWFDSDPRPSRKHIRISCVLDSSSLFHRVHLSCVPTSSSLLAVPHRGTTGPPASRRKGSVLRGSVRPLEFLELSSPGRRSGAQVHREYTSSRGRESRGSGRVYVIDLTFIQPIPRDLKLRTIYITAGSEDVA